MIKMAVKRLRGKVYQMIDPVGGKEHDVCIVEDIKSAVEWYLKYKDDRSKLYLDYLKLNWEFVDFAREHKILLNTKGEKQYYEKWLLHKAFEDVMKK